MDGGLAARGKPRPHHRRRRVVIRQRGRTVMATVVGGMLQMIPAVPHTRTMGRGPTAWQHADIAEYDRPTVTPIRNSD